MKTLLLTLVLAQSTVSDVPHKGWRVKDTEVCVDHETYQKHINTDIKLQEEVEAKPAFPIQWALIGLLIGAASTYAVMKAGEHK